MIKIPNYNVIVPTTPYVRLSTKRRITDDGNRNPLEFTVAANETTIIELPWNPTSPHWVEIYLDGIRLINPKTASNRIGQQYEVFNVVGRVIRFFTPITGTLRIVCDTAGAHWFGSLIIDGQNVQAFYQTDRLFDLITREWPITSGLAQGTSYSINYKPGPTFQNGSYIVIQECVPTRFNGRFLVNRSTEDTVYFNGPVTARSTISRKGTISGFGNLTINTTVGIGLYCEPIVITQPYHGYARLTTDRRSIAYVPDKNYIGNDTFSWALINQHGQIGEPKCCNINVSLM